MTAFLLFAGASSALAQQRPSMLEAARDTLLARNARAACATIWDVRPLHPVGLPQHVVIVRGLVCDKVFRGALSDELFGIFLANDSLTRIVGTLGVVPTRRWNDYTLTVDRVTRDSVVIRGRGDMYGDAPWRHAYALPPE